MEIIDNFLGRWALLPEQANYEFGVSPFSGTYEIIKEGETLTFNMDWVDSEGKAQSMSYSEICDGKFHEMKITSIADELCLSLKSSTILQSIAKKNDEVILSATRELITPNTLKVTMSGTLPEQGSYNNVSIYTKL